ncbi:MAG: mechanosensitive ion channel protein MscS [Hadesarchaea archaeon CG08_land_8_20_14_0_20_51_8]|nr:MAG: mechanosensitive ion channel protein MscS [Hadesarchaea archaeon CG08_land_8_20_14_0_20_51_8]
MRNIAKMTTEELLQLLIPILILVGFIVAGYVLRFALNVYITKLARKTKTKIDDIILDAIRMPIVVIFLIVGINFALPRISFVPAEVIQYLPIVSYLLVVLLVAWITIKTITGILKYYGTIRPALKTLVPTLQKIVKFVVVFFALMIILNRLGVDVTAAVAAFGIGGLAIAFALQGTLSEFFAGMYIMTDRPVRVGDYIALDSGQKGYVVDVGLRSTKIRELPNNIIVVPNSKLAGAIVTNYYLPEKEMACLIQVGVSYGSDLEKVERVTIDVAKKVIKRVEGEMPGFEPFIRYHTFGDFSINFTVILRVKEFVDQYLLTHEFIKELHKRYRKEGIEIPYPIRTIYSKKS